MPGWPFVSSADAQMTPLLASPTMLRLRACLSPAFCRGDVIIFGVDPAE